MVELAQIVCWYNGFTKGTFFPILASEPYLRPFFMDLKTYSFAFSFLLIAVYSQKCLNSLYFSLTFFFFPYIYNFCNKLGSGRIPLIFFFYFWKKNLMKSLTQPIPLLAVPFMVKLLCFHCHIPLILHISLL